jgi:hypothetical protein
MYAGGRLRLGLRLDFRLDLTSTMGYPVPP